MRRVEYLGNSPYILRFWRKSLMASILAVLQVITCVFLILLIMIQDPKGGGSGLFSGNSNSIIGSTGGADFLTKLTRYVAILFGALCIGLTIVTKPSRSGVFAEGATPAAIQQQTEKPTTPPVEGATPFDKSAPGTAAPAAPTPKPGTETK